MKILVTLVVAACLVGRADVAGAFWILDADANAIWEDNVGLGKFKRDINSDSALSTSLSAGPAFQLDTSTVFSLTGDVSGKLYERYTGLDNVALGLTATLRRKFGLGAEAPTVALPVQVTGFLDERHARGRAGGAGETGDADGVVLAQRPARFAGILHVRGDLF